MCARPFLPLLASALLFASVSGSRAAAEQGPVKVVPGRRQLFLDDYLVAQMKGLKRVLHQPRRHDQNPVLVGDNPWEVSADMPSALYEPDSKKFRLWYRCIDAEGACRVAYAEGKDGLRFDKPRLGLIDYRGNKGNNLVWGRMSDWANPVHRFPDEPDVGKRYKCLIWPHPPEFEGHYGNIGLYSPDGLRWTRAPAPTSGKVLDHAYNFCYDPLRREYLSLIQFQTRPRTVGRMVSKDFVNWHGRREVLTPDDQDPPGTEFYIPTVTMIDELYLCFLHIFHADPKEAMPRQRGTIDVQLATSRDGRRWQRAVPRGVFLPLGPKGAFDRGMVFCGGQPVEHRGRLLFYYGGWDGDHGDRLGRRKGAIGLATLRKDGYVSVEPEEKEGVLLTRPFRLDGSALRINADASRGELRVAVLDEAGKPCEGFSLEEAVPITGDGLNLKATWKGEADLSALKGKVVRLQFHLRSTRCYAFLVEE